MKVEIQGRPEFRFMLTLAQVDVLVKLSRGHYDSVCRAASDPNAPHGDHFIYTWRACVEGAGEDYTHRASWRQLDVCLKIMEMAGMCTRQEKAAVDKLRHAFFSAMSVANNHAATWTAEFKSTP
jgi:hypothetical protein